MCKNANDGCLMNELPTELEECNASFGGDGITTIPGPKIATCCGCVSSGPHAFLEAEGVHSCAVVGVLFVDGACMNQL